MYVDGNPKTKAQLKRDIAAGAECYVISPGPFSTPFTAGQIVSVEGPHYPKPHSWYARVLLDSDGRIVKVVS